MCYPKIEITTTPPRLTSGNLATTIYSILGIDDERPPIAVYHLPLYKHLGALASTIIKTITWLMCARIVLIFTILSTGYSHLLLLHHIRNRTILLRLL